MANHADPDGRNAFPAVATLTRYTRLSERSVHYALRTLHELGLITPADPDIVAAHIKRADRRPNGWDLAIHTTTPTIHNVVHSSGDEVQTVHPAHSHEVQTPPDGVQTTTSRGAETAPEPSRNHPRTTRERARGRPAAPARPPGQPAATAAGPPPPPLCGQCDARPGDPISARILWLDPDRQRSAPCPRCHPTAATRHQPTSQPRQAGAEMTPTGDRTTTSPPATPPNPTSPAATAGPRSTRSPAHATAHRGDTQ